MTDYYRFEILQDAERDDGSMESLESGRTIYTDIDLCKRSAVELFKYHFEHDFENAEVDLPTVNDFHWVETKQGHAGYLQGWTMMISITTMELVEEK